LSHGVVRDVLDGRADLGVVSTGVLVPAGLIVEPWREDRLVAVVHASHPLAGRRSVPFEELLDYEHISIGESLAVSLQLSEAAERIHRTIRHIHHVSTTEAGRRLAAAGHGVAVLPDGMVLPFEAAMRIRGVPLAEDWAHRQHRLLVRDGGLSAAARQLLQHLRHSSDPSREGLNKARVKLKVSLPTNSFYPEGGRCADIIQPTALFQLSQEDLPHAGPQHSAPRTRDCARSSEWCRACGSAV
jgi:DNA-binding transcriptional LysR family regulator